MNREMLANIIERHASTLLPGDPRTFCGCGWTFSGDALWAAHVVDVIYPRS